MDEDIYDLEASVPMEDLDFVFFIGQHWTGCPDADIIQFNLLQRIYGKPNKER
jgi:hypothetical protein